MNRFSCFRVFVAIVTIALAPAPRLSAHDLARSESNPELKEEIVKKLALVHDKAATDYMMEILNK